MRPPFARRLALFACLSLFTLEAGAAVQKTSRLPISFEPSQGQARFIARGLGYALFVTDSEAVAVVKKATVRIGFSGARKPLSVTGEDPLPGHANYFIGNDPTKWRTDVPTFRQVRAKSLYEGIDLVYYGTGDNLEYDFVVHPGADPRQIRLTFDGADRIDQNAQGDIVLHVDGGTILQHLPAVYQESHGARTMLHARYRRTSSHTFAFDVADFDRTKTLVIDPTIAWSTYLGGSNGRDVPLGIGVDAAGNTYVAGATNSGTFPTAAPYQAALHGGYDAFIAKIDPSGSSLVYSTYLGGAADDYAFGLAVKAAGDVFMAGLTQSANFPTTSGAYQTSLQGISDGFAMHINSSGNALLYSTLIGKSGDTDFTAIAIDATGNAHVTGSTSSSDYPTTPGAVQAISGTSNDAVLTVLNPTGTALLYSTYFGGAASDGGEAIALDGSGNTYIAGYTESSNFPVSAGVFQPALAAAGTSDGWVAKFTSSNALAYSTYLGGSAADLAGAIAVDAAGNAYVTGDTHSPNFPVTPGAFQTAIGGTRDAFISKLNATGSMLVYSTYLGGSADDVAVGISLDAASNAYVCGATTSSDFPIVNATQPTYHGSQTAFVTKIDPTGSSVLFSTYLGGSGGEIGETIHVNAFGDDIRVAGFTQSTDFPTVHSLQPPAVSPSDPEPDGFVTQFVFGQPDLTVVKTHTGNFIQGAGPFSYTIRVTNSGTAATIGTVTVTDTLPAGMTATAMTGSGWSCDVNTLTCTSTTPVAAGGSYPDITLTVNATAAGSVTNIATVSGGGETNTANDTASDPTTVLPNTAIPLADRSVLILLAILLTLIATLPSK